MQDPNRAPLIITVVIAIILIVCVISTAGGVLYWMQSSVQTQVADVASTQLAVQQTLDAQVKAMQATLDAQAKTIKDQQAGLDSDQQIFTAQTATARAGALVPTATANVNSAAPTNFIAAVSGKVTGIRFYQCDTGIVDLDKRKYVNTFDSATVKYICYELNLAYPKTTQKIPFTIEAEWIDADGNVINRLPTDTFVDKGWTSSFCTDGLGAKTGDIFKPGVNTLRLYVDTVLVAQSTFTVK